MAKRQDKIQVDNSLNQSTNINFFKIIVDYSGSSSLERALDVVQGNVCKYKEVLLSLTAKL